METDNNQTNPQIKERKRSRLYPRFDLEDIVNLTAELNKLGGSRISIEAFAGSIGKAINNSGFIGRVSAAKQFGLITSDGGKLSLTALAQRIFYPKNDTDKQAALREAFATPELYKELIENYNGKPLPERQQLGNILKLDYGIEAAARDGAAINFIQSAGYLGLTQNGIFVIDGDYTSPAPDEQNNGEIKTIQQQPKLPPKPVSPSPENSSNDHYYNFGGIRVYIPRTQKAEDAILDGEFSEAKAKLKEFAKKFLNIDTENNDEKTVQQDG